MQLKMLKRFYWMSLRTGGLIVGCLSILASIITIIVFAYILTNFHQEKNKEAIFDDSIIVTIAALYFLSSILFIVGTMKDRQLMLLPWLIITGILLEYLLLYIIVNFFWKAVFVTFWSASLLILLIIPSALLAHLEYAMISHYHNIGINNTENYHVAFHK